MWPQIAHALRRLAVAVPAVAWAGAVASWRVVRPVLRGTLHLLLAIVVIFEEWGWQPLAALLARLARFKPWAMVESWLAGLPPYGALAAFALPMTLLFPLKLLAVYLFTSGKLLAGTSLLIGAKLTSTAFVARIFTLTRPALMRIGWFARAYAWFVPWEEAAVAWLRASWAWRAGRIAKHRAIKALRTAWVLARPRLEALGARVRAQVRIAWMRGLRTAQAALPRVRDAMREVTRRVLGRLG